MVSLASTSGAVLMWWSFVARTPEEMVTARELAEKLNITAKDLLGLLIQKGVMVTTNQALPHELAEEICTDLEIDDDEGLLLSIKATLVSSGLPEPALVSDSRRVIDLIRKYDFQLILLDLMMPHLTGMEILRRIKKESLDVECVIVSAIDDVASAVQAISLGASDYLVKPLDEDELIAKIQKYLG